MIFNNKIKGQGALEYLLLIGGAVLIAVIVIALLVGMGSENATTARERNTAALEAIDTPIPSTISTVSCLNNGDALINWNPVFKENYQYQLTVDGVVCDDCNFDVFESSENPKLVINGCYNLPAAFIITTKNGEKTAASNSFVKEDQALSFRVNAPKSVQPDGFAFPGENIIVTLTYDEGTEVIYTLDGTDPLDFIETSSTPTYLDANGHIYITFAPSQYSITLKARAFDLEGNLEESSLLSRTYYRIAKPEASLVSGSTVTSGTSVTLSDSVTDNPKQIYYTIDGGTPIYANPNTNLYTGPIILNDIGTITIKAATRKSGIMGLSNAFTYTVVNQPVVAMPTANPGASTYTSAQSVTLTTETSGATIRYTTNGPDPTCSSGTKYSNPIIVATNTTIKAIGCKTGETPSGILTASYVINNPVVAMPKANPTPGVYPSAQSVTLTTETSGATIRYTINGTPPSCSTGLLYGSAISISETTTIKAIGCKTNYTPSAIMTETYTISALPTNMLAYYPEDNTITFTLTPDINPSNKVFLRFFDKYDNVIAESDPATTLNEFNSQNSPYNIVCEDIKLDLREMDYIRTIEDGEMGDIRIINVENDEVLAVIPAASISIGVNSNSFIFHPEDNTITFTLTPDINPSNKVFLRFFDKYDNVIAESDPATTLNEFNSQNSPYNIVCEDIKLDLREMDYIRTIEDGNMGDIRIINAENDEVLAVIPAGSITHD